MGQRVAVMDRGRIVQVASPMDLYDRPVHRFVAQFVGDPPMNLLPCEVSHDGGALRLRPVGLAWETAWAFSEGLGWADPLRRKGPGRVDLGLRPEHLSLNASNAASDELHVLPAPVEVRRLEPRGHETLATLTLGPHAMGMRLPPRTSIRVGDQLSVGLDASRAVWFDSESGVAL